MATLSIKIAMDNAAFDGSNGPLECSQILRGLALLVETSALLSPDLSQFIRDSNSNTIGSIEIKE